MSLRQGKPSGNRLESGSLSVRLTPTSEEGVTIDDNALPFYSMQSDEGFYNTVAYAIVKS